MIYPNPGIGQIRNYEMLDLSGIKNLAITGANGFVGKSVVENISTLREDFLPEKLTLITRQGISYQLSTELNKRISHIYQDLTLPWSFHSDISHIINLAADGTKNPYSVEASIQFEKISTNLVNWLNNFDTKTVVFHASSGACFGLHPSERGNDSENQKANFAKNRIEVENFLIKNASGSNYDLNIARLFSFSGRNLLEKRQYALTNFVYSAVKFKEIHIKGNPLTQRSYLHQDAMSQWILKALISHKSYIDLQIGSNQALTLKELAEFVADATDAAIEYTNKPEPADIYIPNNEDTRIKLGVEEGLGWRDAVLEMISEAKVLKDGS